MKRIRAHVEITRRTMVTISNNRPFQSNGEHSAVSPRR
jgi:hypothetical protein